MKTLILAVILAVSLSVGFSAAKTPIQVTSEQAINHIGKLVEVVDMASSIGRGADGVAYLNFGMPYPHQYLTIILPIREVTDLGGVDWLLQRLISVKGVVFAKKGRVFILVTNLEQIVDMEADSNPRKR